MTKNGKLKPNIDAKSTKILNLTVLQRRDPYVEDILITVSHVVLYVFDIDSGKYSRKDVEGSLFVVKRNTQPRFQFIVMNRLNTDNLVEDLLGNFEYEIQLPYLLYRNAAREVNGVWFYNARECEEVGKLFSRILGAFSKVPGKSKVSPTYSEFEDLDAISTKAVINEPLEPSSTNSNNAMNLGVSPNAILATPRPQTVGLPTLATPQPQLASASKAIMSILETSDSKDGAKGSIDLVKPSSFICPTPYASPPLMVSPVSYSPSSSMFNAPPLNNMPAALQTPYGAPLLQPFPPPTPPPSLTPTSYVPSPSYGPVVSREKVCEALQVLVQDNQFIDMVYRALLNAHQ